MHDGLTSCELHSFVWTQDLVWSSGWVERVKINKFWKKNIIIYFSYFTEYGLCLRLVCPVLHIPTGATIASRPAARFRINLWRMVGDLVGISLFGDWVNALECPSLRLVIPGIAVSSGVTHSDSRIIVFVTGTVVQHQPTPCSFSNYLCFSLWKFQKITTGLLFEVQNHTFQQFGWQGRDTYLKAIYSRIESINLYNTSSCFHWESYIAP